MEFKRSVTPDSVEVGLSGRLEFTDHDRLRDVIDALESARGRRFVIDLSGLEFIDSAGLGMLLILQDEAEVRNVPLVARGAQGDVKRSIDLARISEIVTFEP